MGLIERVLPSELKLLILSYIPFPYTRYFILQSKKCIPPPIITLDEENNTVSTPSAPISKLQQVNLLIHLLYGYFKSEVQVVEGETKPKRHIFLIYEHIEWDFHYCFKFIKEKCLFENIFPSQMVGLHCHRGSWKDFAKFVTNNSKEPIFPKLRSLSFSRISFGDYRKIILLLATWFPQLEILNFRPNPSSPFLLTPQNLKTLLSSFSLLQKLYLPLLHETSMTKEIWNEYVQVLQTSAPPSLKFFYTGVSPPKLQEQEIIFANSSFWNNLPFLRYFRTMNPPFQIGERMNENYTNTSLLFLDLSSSVQPSIVGWICKHFTSLQSLHLQSTQLQKQHLELICSKLPQLVDLNISMNYELAAVGAFPTLQKLLHLETLDISGITCTITDFTDIVSHCSSLRNLLMSYCNAEDNSLFAIFTHAICPLEQLVISHNLITFESVKELTKDSSLKKLEWNKPILSQTDDNIHLLQYLKVSHLSIIANSIHTDAIASLLLNKNLQSIDLSVCHCVYDWTTALRPLKFQDCTLQQIYLDQNDTLDDSVFIILLQINKRLQHIQMMNCKKIRGNTIPLIPIVEFNPNLQYINLNGCKLIKQAEEYLLQRETISTVIL